VSDINQNLAYVTLAFHINSACGRIEGNIRHRITFVGDLNTWYTCHNITINIVVAITVLPPGSLLSYKYSPATGNTAVIQLQSYRQVAYSHTISVLPQVILLSYN